MKPSNDREAVTLILQGLVDQGCQVTGVVQDDWNPDDVTKVSTVSEAVDAVMEVDEAVVYIVLPADHERTREGLDTHIYFVLGNSPEEVACDHGVSLSPYIDPITNPWWN